MLRLLIDGELTQKQLDQIAERRNNQKWYSLFFSTNRMSPLENGLRNGSSELEKRCLKLRF